MAWALKSEVLFASVGADGSVRMFDLRNLEHSSIIYESENSTPLLRLVWNKQDPNYVATLQMDHKEAIVLDIRVPSKPCCVLKNHNACVNALAWAPHSSCHICTAGDDKQTLIWDLQAMPAPIEGALRVERSLLPFSLRPRMFLPTYTSCLLVLITLLCIRPHPRIPS